jgi:hypothetical protein
MTRELHHSKRGVSVAVLVIAIGVGFASIVVDAPIAGAAFPSCPTQKQLEQRGATAAEVASEPQMSTGKFPIAANVVVPDQQCSYQGSWALILLYWQLTKAQESLAKAHFAYECKVKSCTVYLARGTNVVTNSSPGGKTTTLPTLNEVVLGKVNGEAMARNPSSSNARCDELARTLYSFVVGAGPQNTPDILEELVCP